MLFTNIDVPIQNVSFVVSDVQWFIMHEVLRVSGYVYESKMFRKRKLLKIMQMEKTL